MVSDDGESRDSFEVTAKETHILSPSPLVHSINTNLHGLRFYADSAEYELDQVEGGYVEEEGYHVLRLDLSQNIPAGCSDFYLSTGDREWMFEVEDTYQFPDDDGYTVCLKVTGYDETALIDPDNSFLR